MPSPEIRGSVASSVSPPASDLTFADRVVRDEVAGLDGGRPQHRVEETREALVELVSAETHVLARSLLALGHDPGGAEDLEAVARGRLRHRQLDLAALQVDRVWAARELPDDLSLESTYVWGMLPAFVLAGIGFALSFGPLNVAATGGVAAEEQGLAGGLLNTSFQFGGAVVLAVVTAVNNANTGNGAGAQAVLDGFHAALYVTVAAALVGTVAMTTRRRAVAAVPAVEGLPVELLDEAA